MDWALGFILAVALLLPVGVGLGLGAYRAVQNPSFLGSVAAAALSAAGPILKELVLRRNPPDVERRMQECFRKGGRWDNFKKRCLEPR
jgi:hypothetical protein